MNKKKSRLLICAIAAAVTGFTFGIPVTHAADDAYVTALNSASPGEAPTIDISAQQQTAAEPAASQPAEESQPSSDNTQPSIAPEDADTAVPPAAAGTMNSTAANDSEVNKENNAPTESTVTQSVVQSSEKNDKTAGVIDKWREQRPQEDTLIKTESQYDGKTIVSVDVAGMEKLPVSTVTDIIKLKAGNAFKGIDVETDRQAIYDTGLFYDNYPTFAEVPEGVKVTYHVMENPVLRKIEIKGNKELSTGKIESLLTVKDGEILNSKILSNDIANIEAEYRKEGFILAKASDMNINEDGVLDLKFSEGILEGYTVKGNDKTKAKVITREMRMKPGDTFNAKLAKRSMQRIYNLGFFEDVNMKLLPGKTDNGVIIETTVVEKRTGSFGIGAGYSNSDGMIGMISLSDINFRGTGDAAKLTYEFGGNDDDDHGITFSYRHPWMDSKETSMTLRLYDRTYEYDDYDTDGHEIEEYDKNYKGGEITFGRPANEYITNYITLKNRQDEYKGHEDGPYDRSKDEPEAKEWRDNNFGTTRSITLMHTLDTRDNVYNPTEGSSYSLSVEFAGLGGDFNYDKYVLSSQRYYNLGHSHVLALRLDGGYSDNDLPEAGQFQIGGQGSLRGYKDNQFKGNNMLSGTVEYRFPVIRKVQGALFYDAGDAWSGKNWSWQSVEDSFSLHHSYGIGVQIETPVGPLRFDYGRGEDGGRTHFSVGGTF